MKLTDTAVRVPTLTIVATLLILLWGINYYSTMSRREDPDVEIIACWIVTIYPGALPEDVEQYVTKPIEDAVAQINEVDEIRSESGYSYSRVTVVLDEDTPSSKIKQIWDNMRAKLETVKGDLPDGCGEPILNDSIFDTCSHMIAITGDDYTPRELAAIGERIKDRLGQLPDAGTVSVTGAQKEQIYVEFNPERMAQLGVPVTQLMNALKSANLLFPGGQFNSGGSEISIDAAQGFKSLADIENLPVYNTRGGQQVYLRDVAAVRYSTPDPPEAITRVNGKPGVLVTVVMKDGKNVIELGKQVEEELGRIRQELPADVQVSVVHDQPFEVGKATGEFMLHLYLALIFVFLVVLLFMGVRASIPVGLAVPLSLIGSFAVFSVLGVDLQRISIGGLIITLGMLVDDAIVITDVAQRNFDAGMNRQDAAISAVKTLFVPVSTATLTTVAAFLPLLMVPGMIGQFIKDIPIAVCVAMMLSLLVAITVTPAVCAYLLISTKKHKQFQPLDGLMKWLERKYPPILQWTQQHRVTTLVIVIAVFAVAITVAKSLGVNFFPSADRDQFAIDMFAPEGTAVPETEWLVEQVEAILNEQDGIQNYVATIGEGGPKYYLSRLPNGKNSALAEFVIRTETGEDTHRLASIMKNEIYKRVPGVRAEVKLLELGPPVGAPIALEIHGTNIAELRKIGNQVEQVLNANSSITSVNDSFGFNRPQLHLVTDPAQLRAVGLSAGDLNQMTALLTNGAEVTQYRAPERTIPVVLRAQKEFRDNGADLSRVYVQNAQTGAPVPLSSLARLETVDVISKIQRQDRERQLTVEAFITEGVLADDVMKQVKPALDKLELPSGYSITEGGEKEMRDKSFRYVLQAMLTALLLIMVMLVAQFQSLRISLVAYIAIPLAMIGAFFALKLTGWPVSFMAMLGMLSLMGIVMKTSIVLVDYIMDRLRLGMSLDDAIRVSGQARLRPIILAATTALVGLIPLALMGGGMWEPMAWAIIGGLTTSTTMTLLIVPLLFRMIAAKRAVQLAQQWRERNPELAKAHEEEARKNAGLEG
jgi:multidrug efflux pump subunit AcrB